LYYYLRDGAVNKLRYAVGKPSSGTWFSYSI